MKKAQLSNFLKRVILNMLFINSILNNSLGWAQNINLGYQNFVLSGPLTRQIAPTASPSDIEKSKCDAWQILHQTHYDFKSSPPGKSPISVLIQISEILTRF